MGMEDLGDMTYRKALNTALRILARRDHSVVELIQKLTRRGYEEDMVQRVAAECRRMNYLDDGRAVGQVIARMKRKGMGALRIRNELHQRGLDGEQTERQLRAGVTLAEELSMARRVAFKKWQTLSSEPDVQKKKLRLQRFLRYRGFSDSVIFEMLKDMHS
jgi:regulatory protein